MGVYSLSFVFDGVALVVEGKPHTCEDVTIEHIFQVHPIE